MLNITKPTLLLNESICKANIHKMTEKARLNNIILRPHFKTHQSKEVAEYFRAEGIDKCTVSSITMARYFTENHWNDITIAFPLNIYEIDSLNEFDNNIILNLCLEDVFTCQALANKATRPYDIYIKIDTGNHRTGIPCENIEEINTLIHEIQKYSKLKFVGFLSHAGHSYKANSSELRLEIHNDNRNKLLNLKKHFEQIYKNINIKLSTGDTPTALTANDFVGLDEIRPGVFVYLDIMMSKLGVCSYSDIAICLAAPIIAKHKERNEIVVYAGAVHLSKDAIIENDTPIYGKLVKLKNDLTWSVPIEESSFYKMSQEHGIIKLNDSDFNSLNIGDIVGILPIHACLTADKMGRLLSLSGKEITMMKY